MSEAQVPAGSEARRSWASTIRSWSSGWVRAGEDGVAVVARSERLLLHAEVRRAQPPLVQSWVPLPPGSLPNVWLAEMESDADPRPGTARALIVKPPLEVHVVSPVCVITSLFPKGPPFGSLKWVPSGIAEYAKFVTGPFPSLSPLSSMLPLAANPSRGVDLELSSGRDVVLGPVIGRELRERKGPTAVSAGVVRGDRFSRYGTFGANET